MRLRSVLPIAVLLPFASAAAQQPLQVYLHPAPTGASVPDAAPTLSAAQAKAVLSHHLGEPIAELEEVPNDENLWSHLMGLWGSDDHGAERAKARVVIVEGGVQPQGKSGRVEILPTSLKSPSFYLQEETSTRALLAPYLQQAMRFLEDVWHSMPEFANRLKDQFDLTASHAAAVLGKELSSLAALAEDMPRLGHSKHLFPWEAITISGLSHLDRDDEVWETGRKGVQAGLEAMTQPDSPPLLLIIVPAPSTHTRQARAIPFLSHANPLAVFQQEENDTVADNKTSQAEACYSSEEACSSSTSCFGRGTCALKGKTGDGECWGCKCKTGYAGVSCQKEDYTVPFVIIIISTLLLLGTVAGSIALLYSVGETKLPSTLNLAIGGHMKRD